MLAIAAYNTTYLLYKYNICFMIVAQLLNSAFSSSTWRMCSICTLFGTTLIIVGCAAAPDKTSAPKKNRHMMPTVVSRSNPSAWLGQYGGTIPCMPANQKSCSARKIHLTLSFDNTYRLITTVLRPRGKPYKLISNGRFVWDTSGRVITLASKDGNARLQLASRKLIRLPSLHDEQQDGHIGYILYKQ